MSEMLKYKGRLSEKKLELKRVEIKFNGLLKAIRNELDPFEKIKNIHVDQVMELAIELSKLKIDHDALVCEIEAIEKVIR